MRPTIPEPAFRARNREDRCGASILEDTEGRRSVSRWNRHSVQNWPVAVSASQAHETPASADGDCFGTAGRFELREYGGHVKLDGR